MPDPSRPDSAAWLDRVRPRHLALSRDSCHQALEHARSRSAPDGRPGRPPSIFWATVIKIKCWNIHVLNTTKMAIVRPNRHFLTPSTPSCRPWRLVSATEPARTVPYGCILDMNDKQRHTYGHTVEPGACSVQGVRHHRRRRLTRIFGGARIVAARLHVIHLQRGLRCHQHVVRAVVPIRLGQPSCKKSGSGVRYWARKRS